MSNIFNSSIADDQSQTPAQPSFAWIAQAGGPDIQAGQIFEHGGAQWHPSDKNDSITFRKEHEAAVSVCSIQPGSNAEVLRWDVVQWNEGHRSERSGESRGFSETVAAVLSVELKAVEFAGRQWFERAFSNGRCWLAEPGGMNVQVMQRASGDWLWFRPMPLSCAEKALFDFLEGHESKVPMLSKRPPMPP